jgi:hypothetical protein
VYRVGGYSEEGGSCRCAMLPFNPPSSSSRSVVLVLMPLSRERLRRPPPPPNAGTAKGLPNTTELLAVADIVDAS